MSCARITIVGVETLLSGYRRRGGGSEGWVRLLPLTRRVEIRRRREGIRLNRCSRTTICHRGC